MMRYPFAILLEHYTHIHTLDESRRTRVVQLVPLSRNPGSDDMTAWCVDSRRGGADVTGMVIRVDHSNHNNANEPQMQFCGRSPCC